MSLKNKIANSDNSLFQGLDKSLQDAVDEHYFKEPREFRSLLEVLAVLGGKAEATMGANLLEVMKEENPAYSKLLLQQKIVCEVIEQVVMFQHGGLNNTVETMTDVLKEYNRGRDDVRDLRRSLAETQEVLTAKKSGQMSMKDLWLKKVEAEQTLQLLNDVEYLRDVSPLINRLIQRRHYFCGVRKLNHATKVMFGDDMVGVRGLSQVRQMLMETKGHLLEDIVLELQNVILGDRNLHLQGLEDTLEDDRGTNLECTDDTYDIAMEIGGRLEMKKVFTKADALDKFHSLELLNLDEEGEAALEDRSSQEGLLLFLRYLVRAVGELQYEQDAERMVLDSAKSRYAEIVRHLRKQSVQKRTKKLEEVFGHAEHDPEQSRLLEMDLFTEYICSLLDFSSKMLVRLLYVLRLLSVMRKLRTRDENPYVYVLQQANRDAVLDLWSHIEMCITSELQMHFVEQAIEDISDTVRLSEQYMSGGAVHESFDEPVVSPRKGAGLNKRSSSSVDDNTAIFTSSSQFAAPVYLPVVRFSNFVRHVLLTEGVIETSKSSCCQAVMEILREFLGSDLIPLIQLTVNSSLREIQMNNIHFTVSSVASGNEPLVWHNGILLEARNSALCVAARICAGAATPLFKYWLQLPQHHVMVLTILERLIIGFISAAKDEMEGCSWSLIGYEDLYRKNMVQFVRENVLFMRYRSISYGDNMSFIDKSDIGIVSSISSGKLNDSVEIEVDRRSKKSITLADDNATCTKKEMLMWAPMWILNPADNKVYPTFKVDDKGKEMGDRMIKDFTCVRTTAAIVRGCDWLANEICNQCANIVKADSAVPVAQEKYGYSHGAETPAHVATNKAVHLSLARNEHLERTALIRHTVHNSAKDLAKLALDGLSTLRAEVQVGCFHFLHPLKQLRFTADVEGINFDGETIVARLGQFLFEFQKSVSASLPSSALAVVFSPLCKLIPRILMMHIINACETGNLPLHGFDRTKPFMVIVASQKIIGIVLERAGLAQETLYDLQETIGVEFEHVRRYITLLDMSAEDLDVYMKENSREYSSDEFYTIYTRAHDGASRQQFDKIWNSISATKRERSTRFQNN